MEENNIFLEIKSDRSDLNYISLDEDFLSWRKINEINVIDISIIINIEFDIEEQEEAGFIKCKFIDMKEINSEEELYSVCTYESQALEEMSREFELLTSNQKEDIINNKKNILYIDGIYIEPKYRNKNIGSYILNNLKSILKYSLNLDVEFIILLPMPVEKIGYLEIKKLTDKVKLNENKKKLEKFYKKNKFIPIKKYMYMK